jgi:uncharacterized protein (UPF0305 family)
MCDFTDPTPNILAAIADLENTLSTHITTETSSVADKIDSLNEAVINEFSDIKTHITTETENAAQIIGDKIDSFNDAVINEFGDLKNHITSESTDITEALSIKIDELIQAIHESSRQQQLNQLKTIALIEGLMCK